MTFIDPQTMGRHFEPDLARRLAHESLDCWLDDLEQSWRTVLAGGADDGVRDASSGRPDLPEAVRAAVHEYVKGLIGHFGGAGVQ